MKINLISTSFFILLLSAFSRPLVSVLEGRTPIPLHKLIPVGFSYLLLLLLFFCFSKIKWNSSGIVIVVFCLYAISSLLWGSNPTALPELLLPYIGYFAARTFVRNEEEAITINNALIIGFAIPIVGSAIFMLFKLSPSHHVYGSGVLRQTGLYVGSHTAAHSMVIFSFIYALFLTYKKNVKTIYQYFFHILFILSIYTLWNTYVRSGILTLFIFWSILLFFWRRKYFYLLIILIVGFGILFSSMVQSIFWKADTWDRQRNLDTASSGRIQLWSHNLKLFTDSPVYKKMLGFGLGTESKRVIGGEKEVWSSHNDFISLLMMLGVFGLLVYILINTLLFYEIILIQGAHFVKIIFLSAIAASICTSMVTNGYVFRIEAGQLFWLIFGYGFHLIQSKEIEDK